MPGMSGFDLQARLIATGHAIPTIFITAFPEDRLRARAEAGGALGFLSKPFDDQVLLDAINGAIERDRQRRRHAAQLAGLQARYAALTEREREIFKLVVAGQLNKQIAADLGLAVVTVKVHRAQVMHKMAAKSIVDLVRMADQLGVPRRA